MLVAPLPVFGVPTTGALGFFFLFLTYPPSLKAFNLDNK
jgi:hypothetical protein